MNANANICQAIHTAGNHTFHCGLPFGHRGDHSAAGSMSMDELCAMLTADPALATVFERSRQERRFHDRPEWTRVFRGGGE